MTASWSGKKHKVTAARSALVSCLSNEPSRYGHIEIVITIVGLVCMDFGLVHYAWILFLAAIALTMYDIYRVLRWKSRVAHLRSAHMACLEDAVRWADMELMK